MRKPFALAMRLTFSEVSEKRAGFILISTIPRKTLVTVAELPRRKRENILSIRGSIIRNIGTARLSRSVVGGKFTAQDAIGKSSWNLYLRGWTGVRESECRHDRPNSWERWQGLPLQVCGVRLATLADFSAVASSRKYLGQAGRLRELPARTAIGLVDLGTVAGLVWMLGGSMTFTRFIEEWKRKIAAVLARKEA
jgi:hypothetical protein